MIRNVILHLHNEQPLRIDLFETPSPSDTVLVGTNVRTMSGEQPVFVGQLDATFVFPYAQIRFVEIPPVSAAPTGSSTAIALRPARPEPEPELDLEVDEDFLRRVRET
jgi:hypothetical protein